MSILHFAIFRVRWLRVGAALVLICLISISIQLLLPTDLTSSRARLGNVDLPQMTADEVEEVLTALDNSSFVFINIGEDQYAKRFTDVGLSIDIPEARKIADYNIRQKLIPFSALWRFSNSQKDIPYTYARQTAEQFVSEIVEYSSRLPQPAEIAQDGDVLAVVPDEPGYDLEPSIALDTLGEVEYIDRIEVQLPLKKYRHQFGTEQALELADKANQTITSAPTLKVDGGQDIAIPREEIASWFELVEQDTSYSIELNQAEIDEYLDAVANDLRLPAKNTVVTLTDGQEVSRVEGVSGKVIDRSRVLSQLQDYLSGGSSQTDIDVGFVNVSPSVSYKSSYTQSNQGLALYLKDYLAPKGVFAVSVIDLNSGLKASYNGSRVFTAASTYKLYVAYYAAKQVEAGVVSWDTKLPTGQTLDYCYEQMIVVSSNSCALAVRDFLGAGNINSALRSIGLPTAGFSNSAITSANELSLFLQKLHNGQLMNATHTAELIGMMKRQIHRLAIPTGVAPTPVADKGGFVLSYNHDTGIVYGQNRTYAITILSQYKSKSQLAAVARDVHEFLGGG